MKKALLVGNGFSSQLISNYLSQNMIKIFEENSGELYNKINNLFNPFRKSMGGVYKLYKVSHGYCGEDLFDDVVTGVKFDDELENHIKEILEQNNKSEFYEEYFIGHGLIYQTQKNKIEDTESLLKVMNLYLDRFSEEEQQKVIELSNKILFNNSKINFRDIDEYSLEKEEKYKIWINEYDYVFTTNYDNLLDSIYDGEIKHLHGGFYYSSCDKRENSIQELNDAFCVWGINGDEKYKQINGRNKSYPYTYPYRYGGSLLGNYLSKLQEGDFEEIHIFGYSGDNDSHINTKLGKNSNLKQIFYYTDTKKESSNGLEYEVAQKIGIISGSKDIRVIHYDTLWNKIEKE